jgi:hypothetical protein
VTLGIWRRPWEVHGAIPFPEIGYYQADLFEPDRWKGNYPNLAFVRMDDGDAYWGAKIVTAFGNELVRRLAEAGEYTRTEATQYLTKTLLRRRDAIGRYWFGRLTALDNFTLEGTTLLFRDLAVERGYEEGPRKYRLNKRQEFTGTRVELPGHPAAAKPDRYGRVVVSRVLIQSRRRDGGWAPPVEVVIGAEGVLGWRH